MDSVSKYFETIEERESKTVETEKKYKFSRKELESFVTLVKYNDDVPDDTLIDIFLKTKQ